jgi:3-dehydroquinate synthase
MRGLRFAFVPTTVLAQVDASIGGKNGIDTGLYKNMVGLIRQPEFILFDYNILETLPNEQWVNGFAEIIKHACIKDRDLFELLEGYDLQDFRSDRKLLADLIQRNVVIKSEVVQHDEFETGDRKLLNFGHTIGHAIENVYELPHGHAVSIGIVAACTLSEQINDFDPAEKKRVIALLDKYQLSTRFSIDGEKIMQLLKMDKKRVKDEMSFILLDRIGEAVIKPIPLKTLEAFVSKLYTKEARV